MLGDKDAGATIPVKDVEVGKKFYTEVLGLKVEKEDEGGVSLQSGATRLLMYQSEFAGTNKATALGWVVDDVEAVAAELKSKGVTLEEYDMPGTEVKDGIHIMGDFKGIWFKDPDGNILSVGNMGG